MSTVLKNISLGLKEILFPHVCEICGHQLPSTQDFLCEPCLKIKFEENPSTTKISTPHLLLPEGIHAQYAMWKFDKGGYLQDLLHKLKYNQLSGVGHDLGRQLGIKILQHSFFSKDEDWLLIPVPLHIKKEKTRGYNQARIIAEGISKSTGLAIIQKGSVVRTKNTKTQTGFTLQKRNENVHQAFNVENPHVLKGVSCILVDDVFTTGATTFELAQSLIQAGAGKIITATVANA